MSGQVNPILNPQAWDVLVIGQMSSPGFCKVTGFKRENEWDVKKGKGTVGATQTFVGKPPSKGSVTFYLWTPSHFFEWDVFRKLLKYDPAKKDPQPVDVYYPALADIDVNSVIVESIGQIEHQGQQMYTITVELQEYTSPSKKNAVSTPNGSTSNPKGTPKGTTPGVPPDPAGDAQQKEIARLLAEAAKP